MHAYELISTLELALTGVANILCSSLAHSCVNITDLLVCIGVGEQVGSLYVRA